MLFDVPHPCACPLYESPDSLPPDPAIGSARRPTGECMCAALLSPTALFPFPLFRHSAAPDAPCSNWYDAACAAPLLSSACPLPTLSWCAPVGLHLGAAAGPLPAAARQTDECCNAGPPTVPVSSPFIAVQLQPMPDCPCPALAPALPAACAVLSSSLRGNFIALHVLGKLFGSSLPLKLCSPARPTAPKRTFLTLLPIPVPLYK